MANPTDLTWHYDLALIEQQTAQSLNDQTLENRSIDALKQGLKRLDVSERYFLFLSSKQFNQMHGYDISRASERASYCKGVRKVTEKKIHETEVLHRQRKERLAEIKEKIELDKLEKERQEVSYI